MPVSPLENSVPGIEPELEHPQKTFCTQPGKVVGSYPCASRVYMCARTQEKGVAMQAHLWKIRCQPQSQSWSTPPNHPLHRTQQPWVCRVEWWW